ncbi:hypothetical protein ABRP55_11500 [Pectobacterium zantedeschiae]|nr:hypothetical protein [Pectobacterium zantedeschiae]
MQQEIQVPTRKNEKIRQVAKNMDDWKIDVPSTIIPQHVNMRAASKGNQ